MMLFSALEQVVKLKFDGSVIHAKGAAGFTPRNHKGQPYYAASYQFCYSD